MAGALTSMGTALAVLLFLLALGAVPGALLPQRSLNDIKVDKVTSSNVASSGRGWTACSSSTCSPASGSPAIYVLLFVSLVGRLTRTDIEHARSLRATPAPAPQSSQGFKHANARMSGFAPGNRHRLSPQTSRAGGRHAGQRRHDRNLRRKGYLREFGNIVFHFAALGSSYRIAAASCSAHEGNVIVIADGGLAFAPRRPPR